MALNLAVRWSLPLVSRCKEVETVSFGASGSLVSLSLADPPVQKRETE